jgi:hypothetical protein
MNWKALLVGLFAALGALFISHGAFEISEPVGFLVSGVILIAVALLPDWGV